MEKSIAQRTREQLDNQFLTPKKRRQIKINGVKDYIRSKPSGTPIQLHELINAAGYHSNGIESAGYKAGQQFISKLVKRGVIQRFGIKTYKPSYSIPGDATTKTFKKPQLQAKVQVVERGETDKIPDKPYRVRTEVTEDVSTGQGYSFEFTVSKRNAAGEFGRIRVGQLEMTDVTIETIGVMVEKLLENLS